MIRRRTALFVAAGLLAPLMLTAAPAGAALEQDLVASVTAGPPGTVVTFTSATCVASGNNEAYLDLVAYSGTSPNEKLAGLGSGSDGSATITIPDWVDPDEPMTIEGECNQYSEDTGDGDSITYDPIAFDVEPGGGGTPVQVPSFSRTSLLSGQSTLVSGTGCAADSQGIVIAVAGTDLSGRNDSYETAFGFGEGSNGSFDAELPMTNASVVVNIDGPEDNPTVSTSEEPNTLPLGSYAVFAYCISEDGSALVLEPSLIELTGTAPTDGIDLTAKAGTPDVTIAGQCAAGDAVGDLEGESSGEFNGWLFDPSASPLASRSLARTPQLRGLADRLDGSDGTLRIGAAGDRGSGTSRIGTNGEPTDFSVTPDGSGAWSFSDTAEFDTGFVFGFATCGDPLEDGYIYDPQAVDVDVPPAPPVVSSTVPATVPKASPANAVKGTPTYAG
jgi:hypothetical protein